MATLLEPQSPDPQLRLRARITALERRVADLEGKNAQIPIVSGSPTGTVGQHGSVAGDSTNTRLWLRINNTWHFVALT